VSAAVEPDRGPVLGAVGPPDTESGPPAQEAAPTHTTMPPPGSSVTSEGSSPVRPLSAPSRPEPPSSPVLNTGIAWWGEGGCVLRVATDGSKAPDPTGTGRASGWDRFKTERPTLIEACAMLQSASGLGLVTGEVSGRVVMFELEAKAVEYGMEGQLKELVEQAAPGLWAKLQTYREDSPTGAPHMLYRIEPGTPMPASVALAREPKEPTEESPSKVRCLIEIKAEGGFTILAPSNGSTHPNGKPWVLTHGEPGVLPTLTADEHETLMRCARLLDRMPPPEPVEPRSAPARPGEIRPGDAWAAATDWAEVLEPHGWRHVATRGSVRLWRRPGKNHGISATTGHGAGDWLYVFSTSTVLEANRTHTKFGAYAVLEHGGDWSAAGRELRRRGFGSTTEPTRAETLIGEGGAAAPRPAAQPAAGAPQPTAQPAAGATGQGPDLGGLWRSRPVLQHIHDFARAQMVAPIALLAVVLARVLAATPPSVTLPGLIGGRAGSLNFFIGLLGPSGAGKGATEAAGEDAVILDYRDPISRETVLHTARLGSGEGIAHQYATRVKKGQERTRGCVLWTVSEVDTLVALGSRQGSTLLSVVRDIYDGAALGHAFADPARALDVERHSYRATLIVGIQPGRAGPLLTEEAVAGGTPQRFFWAPVTDPDMPRRPPARPEHTPVVELPSGPHEVKLPQEAVDTVQENQWRRQRGDGDALDGHSLFTRVKVAAALALLDGRQDVSIEDWHISGVLMDISDWTRAGVEAELARTRAEQTVARGRAEGLRAATAEETADEVKIRKAAEAIRGVLTGEWKTTGEIKDRLPGRVKRAAVDALARMVASGEIEAEPIEYRGRPGQQYRRKSC
jgi:hypothetical protein